MARDGVVYISINGDIATWSTRSISGLKAHAGFQVYTPVRVTRVNPCSIIGPSTMINDRLLWPHIHPLYRVLSPTPAISVKVYPTQDPTVRWRKRTKKNIASKSYKRLALVFELKFK